ncbi:MAG: UDP-N-acetylenolpyruvoylglucosamine reductase [Elusimicrobia bacterium CG08_land_8_20_14_0_20_51_18]|nr:MAG: UDP-N-acetylenolpyruvoylglucosamine reductase [Elusimicrobia bacterium CG08_land_8_20_14_0_20_51_18]
MDKYAAVRKKFPGSFREKVPASSFTTYRAGGPVDILVSPGGACEAVWLLRHCAEKELDFFITGESSNILVSDGGFPGVFIYTGAMKNFFFSGEIAAAECGCPWDALVGESVARGLAGLEKTSHIPGSVGGAVYMNAGAYGQETFDRLLSFSAFDLETFKMAEIKKEETRYSYRKVEGIERYFILSASFLLETGGKEKLLAERLEIARRRKEKQPLEYPSAGSVFKRPPGDYASRLIDSCGLKGLKLGGAMVSEKHAGFIINYDKASAADIRALMLKVKEEVLKKTGVSLELEQILVGKFDE